MATMMGLWPYKFTLVCAFFLNLILQTTQTRFGATSYCVDKSINDIQFGPRGPSSYGTFEMSSNDKPSYILGLNCTVQLRAPQGYKLHLAFSEISTRSCELDEIVVKTAENQNGTALCGHRNCPAENCLDLQFDSENITVNFFTSVNETKGYKDLKGFVSMITVFSHADTKGNCYSKDQFRCHNRNCIWNGLYCNKHNHCGDDSDEPHGCKPFAQQSPWGVIVIILGIVAVCFFLPLFVFITIKGQRPEVKIIRSTYQPIPTSINAGENQVYNAAILSDENQPTYRFYDDSASGSSTEATPIHNKHAAAASYQNV